MDNERVSGGSFSPDNSKLLITSDRSGIYNAYTVPTTGGEYTPITMSDSTSVRAISYFPHDERMLLSMDDNGNEIYHIFLRDTDGSVTDLTPFEGSRSSFYSWSQDKKSFFFTSNKRDVRNTDLYEMDIETMTPRMFYKNEKGYDLSRISNNKEMLVLSEGFSRDHNDLYIYHLKTKKLTKINNDENKNSAKAFSTDDEYLYYTSDATGEFSDLMKYDIAGQKSEKVAEKGWDITSNYFTKSGKYQVTTINQDAKRVIEVKDVATGKNLDLPSFDGGSISSVGFSEDEKLMRLYVGRTTTPSNLYVYNLENKKLTQITNVLNPEIDADDMVEARVIRYKSFDGVEIPAIYYLPKQASATNKVPAMVWVHGGPGGQSTMSFRPLIQYMTNNGYAVLQVNNRGSSGYGKTFYGLDDKRHGEGDLQDCVEGKNWLAAQPEIDGEKIGITGGSYGGYMVMAALTFAPEEFEVGVNLFGVTNWMRTLKGLPKWWGSYINTFYKEVGDPYSADSIRLKKMSPLFHVEEITKPLMVLQGAKDPRVLQAESDDIVEAVRARGIPVEYVLFDDEGHGFVKKKNQIKANSEIIKFLDTHLKGEGPEKG